MKSRTVLARPALFLGFAAALAFAGRPAFATPSEASHPVETAAAEHGETAHAGDEHAAHEGHGEHALEPINWFTFGGQRMGADGQLKPNPPPVLANLINFGILLGVLVFALRRMINPALASRRSALEAEINEAQRLRTEAEALHREYTARLARLDTDIAALRDEYEKAGKEEANRILHEARLKAERLEKETAATVEQEIRQLRADLTKEAVDAAVKAAEKALVTQVGAADHARLADDFVTEIEKTPRTGAQA